MLKKLSYNKLYRVSKVMKNKLEKLITAFNNSAYLRPITFFVLLFFACASLAFFLEFRKNDQFLNVFDGLWWAIITFSTTGYGDKVPVTGGGRLITVLTIFIGIAGMSFLSGTFASVFVDQNTRARRGLMDFPKIKDHIIICGWKDHM
ncbi:MAG: potassium channel family protein, partial [Spirochaetota bacterium]